jgi:uncharacterized YigZ family protein
MPAHFYKTIATPSVAEFKEKGSKFLAYAFPITSVQEFKSRLAEIKKEHPKATHHCFAYRIGVDGMNYRVNDNGEPSGSAGRPILGQIDSREITNVLIIVVRYFGGVLLGVPGLINSYKNAAALALQLTQIISKPVMTNYRLEFDYTKMNEVMKLIKQFECPVLQQEILLFCTLHISIPQVHEEEVLHKLKNLQDVNIEKH